MVLDYSSQIGKKITTKGYQKSCISLEDIMFIQCDGELSTIFLNDQSKVDEIKTLKEFEDDLSDKGFIRINRNTIINGKYITMVNTNYSKRVVYLGKIELSISKRRLILFKQYLA
jgi:two-component system LytT family response regulator